MTFSNRSEFVDFIKPLGPVRLKLYDPTRLPSDQPKNAATDPAKRIPQGFLDALAVRVEVFVEEQGIPLDHELDEDDARAWHWVAYASLPSKSSPTETSNGHSDSHNGSSDRYASKSTKLPIGSIRMVPSPNALPKERTPFDANSTDGNTTYSSIKIADVKEPWLKLSRLVVKKEFRKAGISRLLIETALNFAREHPYDVVPTVDPSVVEALRQEHHVGTEFKGLVIVHSQIGVQKLWRRYGFATDESIGTWKEEGIDHVGMWKRIDVTNGRRASKVLLPSSVSHGL